MIIFLAGLQAVPWMLHEAAAIDGASAWQRFRHITLPAAAPDASCSSAVITMIGYLQFFEEPFVMTNGGPLDSTISMSMYTYKQFGFGNYGYAAALELPHLRRDRGRHRDPVPVPAREPVRPS